MTFNLSSTNLVPIDKAVSTPIRHARDLAPGTQALCLTFDDGPDPVYTPVILDMLAAYRVKASFFVLGEAAERFPGLVKRIAAEGHSIGNHSYSHPHPWFLSRSDAQREITNTAKIIEQITGTQPRWFRPPHGRLGYALQQQTLLDNLTTVLWSRSIIDWGLLGSPRGIRQRLDRIAPGDIVLMHDGQREHNRPDNLLRYLPGFLAALPRKGLEACSLDGLCPARCGG